MVHIFSETWLITERRFIFPLHACCIEPVKKAKKKSQTSAKKAKKKRVQSISPRKKRKKKNKAHLELDKSWVQIKRKKKAAKNAKKHT